MGGGCGAGPSFGESRSCRSPLTRAAIALAVLGTLANAWHVSFSSQPEMDFLRNLHDLSLSGYAQRSAATVQQQAEMYLAVAAWKETHVSSGGLA